MANLADPITGSVQRIDATFQAGRASLRPPEVLSWVSVGVATGSITGLAAGGAIFSLRNLSANLLLIRRVGVGFICSTAFTTAQRVEFALQVARAFTASDTSGTAVAITGSNCKHRSSLGVLTSVDCRVAAAAVLTAGAKALDANYIGLQAGFVGAVGAGIAPAQDNLLSHNAGDYPIILAQNEGINIINAFAMGAAGVGNAYINLELAEAVAF